MNRCLNVGCSVQDTLNTTACASLTDSELPSMYKPAIFGEFVCKYLRANLEITAWDRLLSDFGTPEKNLKKSKKIPNTPIFFRRPSGGL